MRRQLAALALGTLLASCAVAKGTFRDDRGVEVTLAGVPHRIVSLLPSITETVCALGACAALVGTDRFSNWPASVVKLPKLGGLEDPHIERIVALKPDVVLAASSERLIDRLEGLGVKVIVVDSNSISDVKRTVYMLGQMLGVPSAAERLWADVDGQMRAAADRVPAGLRGKRVYFEVGSAPYAAGPSSFIGETLARLGLANAIPADLGPFPKLNPEYVVRLQPDIIIASSQSLAEMPKRPGWSSLRALKEQQTCGFPSQRYELLVRPGPRTGEAANMLVDCLLTLKPPS
jgi:cobalamin transport system substrate-binding protein